MKIFDTIKRKRLDGSEYESIKVSDEVWGHESFKALEQAHQDEAWHHESVIEHAHAVLENMYKLIDEDVFIQVGCPSVQTTEASRVLILAALFHDVGKGITSIYNDKTKQWENPNHGAMSEKIARNILKGIVGIEEREKVCSIVKHHMDMHKFVEMEDEASIIKEMIHLSYVGVPFAWLVYMLAADSFGATTSKESREDIWGKCLGIIQNATFLGVLNEGFAFSSIESKRKYFYSNIMDKKGLPIPFQDKDDAPIVHVMVGLLGSGKHYHIERDEELSKLPSVSYDDVRAEMFHLKKDEKRLETAEDTEQVMEQCSALMAEYLMRKQSFIVNNTNMRLKDRKELLALCGLYEAKVVYHYVECKDIDTVIARLEGRVPKQTIKNMWEKFDFPEPWEYDSIEIIENE